MAEPEPGGTRGKILAIAMELFTAHGYHRTSVRAIAEQLGISKAAVLYHFPAKTDILGALAEPFLDDYESALRTASAAGTPDTVRWATVTAVLDVLLAHRHLLRLSLHDLALVSPGPFFDRFRAAMYTANRLVAGEDPSFAERVRAAQAVSILGDPVVLFADSPIDRLRDEILTGLRLLVTPNGLAGTGPVPEPEPTGRGRPRVMDPATVAQARRLRADGLSVDAIAARLGVSRATAYRHLRDTD